jgi:hypothetical protein
MARIATLVPVWLGVTASGGDVVSARIVDIEWIVASAAYLPGDVSLIERAADRGGSLAVG